MRCFVLFTLLLSIAISECVVQRPKGVHLDIGVQRTAMWNEDPNGAKNSYLDLLEEVTQRLNGTGLSLTVEIPFWFNGELVDRDGETDLNFLEEIVKRVDKVSVYVYRDWGVGTRSSAFNTNFNGRTDSMQDLGSQEVQYATALGKKATFIAYTSSDDPPFITFFEEDVEYMEQQFVDLKNHYVDEPGYDGVAILHSTSWMNKNPDSLTRTCSNARDVYITGSNSVSDDIQRNTIVEFCRTHAVRTIYTSSWTFLNSGNTVPLELLLETAYEAGISVEFWAPNDDWGTTSQAGALTYINNIINFVNNMDSPADPAADPCDLPATTGGDSSSDSTTGDDSSSGHASTTGETGDTSSVGTTGSDASGSGAATTGSQSSAGTTGSQSSASTTGSQSSASTTGSQSSAGTTGSQSSASTTGSQSSASTTGQGSSASTTGGDDNLSTTGQDAFGSSTTLKVECLLVTLFVIVVALL